MAEGKKNAVAAPTYTREALASSKKYRPWCDVLMILLEEGKQYTIAEAEAAIEKFKKTPVKEPVVAKL
jgi:hypothetical protein